MANDAIDPSQVQWNTPTTDSSGIDPSQVQWDAPKPAYAITDPLEAGRAARAYGTSPEAAGGISVKRGVEDTADLLAAGASGAIVGGVGGGIAALGARLKAALTGGDPDVAAQAAKDWVNSNLVYHAQTPGAQAALQGVGEAAQRAAVPVTQNFSKEALQRSLGSTAGAVAHTALGTAGDVLNALPGIGAAAKAPGEIAAGVRAATDATHGIVYDHAGNPVTLNSAVETPPAGTGGGYTAEELLHATPEPIPGAAAEPPPQAAGPAPGAGMSTEAAAAPSEASAPAAAEGASKGAQEPLTAADLTKHTQSKTTGAPAQTPAPVAGRPFSIISAERPEEELAQGETNAQRSAQLEADLKARGMPYTAAQGSYYGEPENAFVIHTPTDYTRAQVRQLAAQYGQDTMLHADAEGNSYLRNISDGRDEPLGQMRPVDAAEAQQLGSWTRVGDRYYSTAKPLPPGNPEPLSGMPTEVHVPGTGNVQVGPYAPARAAAESYQRSHGLDPAQNPTDFLHVDPDRAAKVADAYAAMKHAPDDPKVAAAYDALIKETMAQWGAIKNTGLKVEFIKPGQEDPYAASPRLAAQDVRDNNHLWVFPTDSGFGEAGQSEFPNHPLLRPTGVTIDGHPTVANDIFRIVHDYMGHIKEGNGFRAEGEYNAWRVHRPMYSPEAQGALASETLGQNSWVNYGPHGEANRTASGAKTVYADQKAGLLPEELWKNGAEPAAVQEQPKRLAEMLPGQRGGPKIAPRVARNLTPAEQAQLRNNTAQRVVDAFKNAPDTKEWAASALAGQAKRGWYQRAAEAITSAFGVKDSPRFAALLAAMSPQTSVEANFHNALRSWVNWDRAGRPSSPGAIYKILRDSVPRSIDPETGKLGAGVLHAWVKNSVRALTHPTPDTMTISGPKVNSFMNNLRGHVNDVTLDSWMAKFAGLDPKRFSGTINKAETAPGKSSSYLGVSARVRDAAAMLTKMTGEPWTPAEVQETVWSFAKTATEHANEFGGMATIPELVKNREITDELIRSTPDFHNLFNSDEARNAIRGTSLEGRAGELSQGTGGAASVGNASEAATAAAEALRPHLLSAAERLEAARVRDNEEEAAQKADPYALARTRRGSRQRGGPPVPPIQPPTNESNGGFTPPPPQGMDGGPRPPRDQAKAEATLRRVLGPGTEIRESAINGNTRAASSDYQTSKLDNPHGERMAGVIEGERAGLQNRAAELVQQSGGTAGTDRGARYARGKTMVAPLDEGRAALDAETQQHYAVAKERAAGKPATLTQTQGLMQNNKSAFLSTVEGKQLLEGVQARMKELGLSGPNETFNPATVEQAERLRQYVGDAWSPRTAHLVNQLKDALDEDVTKAAGEDIYAKSRSLRAARAALYDNPEGVSPLITPSNINRGFARNVAFEDVPSHIGTLPVDQFAQVVSALKHSAAGRPAIAPKSAAALNEIRSQFANRVQEIGNSTATMWNHKGVNTYLNENLPKMRMVFKPEEIEQFRDLNDAGNYLRIDRGYPGAAVQAHNLMVRGVLGALERGSEAIGAHIGGLPGYVVGHAVSRAAENVSEKSLAKSVEKRIRKL